MKENEAESLEAKNERLQQRLTLSEANKFTEEAIEQTSFHQKRQKEGETSDPCVTYPPSPPGFTDIYQRVDLENIYTQKSAMKEIIQAIKVKQIVGIYGLGGAGKTTIAKEAAAEMMNEFDYIEMITISQPMDPEKIKEDVKKAAAPRITKGDKVLLILDDVWKNFNLSDVGIPRGADIKMNCKVLLTSGNKDVCETMCNQVILIKPLKDEEALTLFERVVGKHEWDDKSRKIAREIVEECGGLPLFVQNIGKALKNKDIGRWESARSQLKAPIDAVAFYKKEGLLQLKLSYDYLDDAVAKSCFLLCSMFPKDGIIGLKKLAYYGLGLGIFKNPHSNTQDAKEKVQHAVDTLKSSFLLQPAEKFMLYRFLFGDVEEQEEEEFKMHDVVRDMGLFITSKGNDEGNDEFWVRSGKDMGNWQPNEDLKGFKKISLIGNNICDLHDHEIIFTHLDTFLVQDNKLRVVSDKFFQGMERLKVLDMSGNNISSLPQSLKHLTQLRTLYLSGNRSLCDISILGMLTCLVILKLGSTGIAMIPEEIGQLTKLRLLDADYCTELVSVASGVISKLISLEELSIELKMVKMDWNRIVEREGNSSFLTELNKLKLLKVLNLKVSELHYIPEDFHFEKLEEFYIKDNIDWLSKKHGCKRILQIAKTSFPFAMAIKKLIQVSEVLELFDIKCLDNILPEICQEGLDNLKYIFLMGCDDVTSLVKTTDPSNDLGQRKTKGKGILLYSADRAKLLGDSSRQYISFGNLASIEITNCSSLVNLFPLRVAQELVKLREIKISYCENLVAVISAGDEQTSQSETAELPLTGITLFKLSKLESFYSGNSTIKYSSSWKFMEVKDCPSMKRWSNGNNILPKMKFKHERKLYSNINNYIAAQVQMNGMLSEWDWCIDDTVDEIIEV